MNDPFITAMFGCNAIHAPMNFVSQSYKEDGAFVAVARAKVEVALFNKLTFNSKATHQLIMGDIILRPHLVVESNHLRGVGLTGILTSGDRVEDWTRQGKVLFDYRKE